jgi:hypothetical protein
MKNPVLALPSTYGNPTPPNPPNPNDIDYDRYFWLVATMLNALAAQVRCKPAKDMRAAMKADLIEHTHFLESEDHNWEHFPKVLKDLYDEAVGG